MNRIRPLLLSLAVGLAAVAGVFALTQTVSLSHQARTSTDRQVAQRTAQLNRYEASLRKALAQKPPALPPLPKSTSPAPPQAAAPVRIVYHRPPPIVITKHRSGGEHEQEGVEADD